jgi:hypothetical protein
MMIFFVLKCFIIILFVWSVSAQQCDQPVVTARFDCHPEPFATQETCLARYCCWNPTLSPMNESTMHPIGVGIPACYYPQYFPTYRIVTNESTTFGQRLTIVKSNSTYMPNEILSLTVDLLYETAQRFRLRIYDPTKQRYEVPLDVPVIQTKVNITDYEVSLTQIPFAILIKRKSNGVTL